MHTDRRRYENLDLFVTAARNARPDLNRRTFVEALAGLTNYQGALVPTLRYGPNRFAGPKQFRTVRIHKNDEANNQCPLKPDGGTYGSCWLLVDDFKPVAG